MSPLERLFPQEDDESARACNAGGGLRAATGDFLFTAIDKGSVSVL